MRDTSFKDRQRLDRTVRDDLVELTTEIAAIKRGSEQALIEFAQHRQRERIGKQADEDRHVRFNGNLGDGARCRARRYKPALKRTSSIKPICLAEKHMPREQAAGERISKRRVKKRFKRAGQHDARCRIKRGSVASGTKFSSASTVIESGAVLGTGRAIAHDTIESVVIAAGSPCAPLGRIARTPA